VPASAPVARPAAAPPPALPGRYARPPSPEALRPDPATVALLLSSTPGVVDHGLFPPSLVSDVLVAGR